MFWNYFEVVFAIIITGESKKKFAVFAANFCLLKRWLFRGNWLCFYFVFTNWFSGEFQWIIENQLGAIFDSFWGKNQAEAEAILCFSCSAVRAGKSVICPVALCWQSQGCRLCRPQPVTSRSKYVFDRRRVRIGLDTNMCSGVLPPLMLFFDFWDFAYFING